MESGLFWAQDRGVERHSLIVRSMWAACLLLAGANHARILIQHGLLWDYGGVGWASAAYWSSLTILDPLAAILLFVRPKIGVLATIVIIATNVIHNLALTARHVPDNEFLEFAAANPQLVSQIAFLLFVAATTHLAWRSGAQG